MRRYGAEFFGTFWLVLGGCGSAVLAAAFPGLGIGFAGVSLAFGLTVLTMAFAIGHISGCHLNPAVSFGLWAGGRFPAKDLPPYILAQVLGAVAAGGVLFVVASGRPGFDAAAGFASNGYGAHSPGGYTLLAALVCEIVMTAMFLIVILGATDKRPAGAGSRRHRALPDPHPPRQHPGDQHLGQPGPEHGRGARRGGLGPGPAVAVLGGADRRRAPVRGGLPLDRRLQELIRPGARG